MGKDILVTGASGFAAEHLIPKLRNNGNKVIGLDRKAEPSADCDDFISVDLSLLSTADVRLPHVDVVIHMAAARADWGVSDEEFMRDNLEATQELLSAYADHPPQTLVFISSISVMPQDSSIALDEKTEPAPINVYGSSKKYAEDQCVNFQEKTGIQLIMIRPSVLYGPSDPTKTGIYRAADNNIFRLIDGIYSNRFASVGSGETIKSTAYIENFVDAILFSMTNSNKLDIYIYADSPPMSINEIIKVISKSLRKKIPPSLPFPVVYYPSKVFDFLSFLTRVNFPINSARVKTLIRPTNFSSKKIIDRGFCPVVDTEDCLKITVKWYLELRKETEGFFMFKESK